MKHNKTNHTTGRPRNQSVFVTHKHNLGDVACTKCGVTRGLVFDCNIPLPKGQCPEPAQRRRSFVCFTCESVAAQNRRDETARELAASILTHGAAVGSGKYDAATVFANMRRMLS